MTSLLLIFLFLSGTTSQDPTTTWAKAKPVVEKWDGEFKDRGRTIAAKERIEKEIQQFLNENPKEIWAYEAAALGFNHLNRNEQALEVIRTYLRNFPSDDTLIERVWFFFMNWGSVEDLKLVSQRWHDDGRYWKALFQVHIRSKSSPDVLEETGRQLLLRIPREKDPGGNERIRVAETWLRYGVNPAAAEKVALEAISISEIGQKPAVIPTSREQAPILNRLLVVNVNRSTLGWAYYHQRRYKDALVQFRLAEAKAESENVTSNNLYMRLGRTLEALNRKQAALNAYFRAEAFESDDRADEAAMNAYREIHGSSAGFQSLRKQEVNKLLIKRSSSSNDLVRIVNQELGRFEPTLPDGRTFDMNATKGRVVIVDFWASWCGICVRSMQQTNRLQLKFPKRVTVVAWSLDTEESYNLAATLLRERRQKFTLVFGDDTRRSIQIPFVPARLIIDRTGKVRVMEYGFTSGSAAKFEDLLQQIVLEH